MVAFLNWLYDKAGRVYEFFGTLYYKIRDAALNAWNWAKSAYTDAIRFALDRVVYYYNRAVEAAKALVNGIIDLAYGLFNQAVRAAQTIVKGAIDLAYALFNRAVEGAQALVNGVTALAWFLYNRAVAGAQALVNGVSALVYVLVDRARYELSRFVETVKATLLQKLQDAGILSPQGAEQLAIFLGDPLAWFLAYLREVLLTTLEWALAYALGAITTTLPPWPRIDGDGFGGPIPVGPGPPPGASPLSPPLAVLRVSGYYFGPRHRGLDFGCTTSDPVYACHDGKVLVAGWSSVGYGNYVILDDGEWWSLYAHLSQIGVYAGQKVNQREPIGLCGCTGNSTCNHLHLELKHYGQYVDPLLVFGLGG